MALSTVASKELSGGSQITSELLQKTVSKINVKIRDHLVDDYTATLKDAHQAIETILAMDDFVPIPNLARFPRVNMYYPTKEENKLNEWAWKVTVKNVNEDEAKRGLLYGKTVCLKDNICLAEVPCLNGTKVFSDWVPNTDATIVTRILEAGGTIIGKAMCENLCTSGFSGTAAQGPVGNPYDPTRSAGGSSSGTGVIIATGQADMGIGGDQGGSIRFPAAHVGIVGLKPTFGLVPYTGMVSGEFSVDHTGPMTPDVLSNALLLHIIAGIDGIDDRQGPGAPLPSEVPNYHDKLLAARAAGTLLKVDDNSLKIGVAQAKPGHGTKQMRIGILKEGFEITGMDPRLAECVTNAAMKFAELGEVVKEISIPGHLTAPIIARVARFSQHHSMLGRANGRNQLYLNDYTELFHPWTQEKFDKLFPTTADIMINGLYADEHYPMLHGKCQNLIRKIRSEYDAALSQVDVLVMPTTPWVAKVMLPVDAPPLAHFAESAGLKGNTQPFDHTGHPALSIPCGMLSPPEGPETLKLPVGMQLVSRHFDELTLYKAALAWSDAFNWKNL